MNISNSEGNMKTRSSLKTLTAAGLILSTLPGCNLVEYFKNKFDNKKSESRTITGTHFEQKTASPSDMLVIIDGQGFLPKEDFQAHLVQMIQAYPQLRGSGITPESLPAGLKQAVLEKLAQQEMIVYWAKKNNIQNSTDFQKAYQEALVNLERLMFVNQFEKELLSKISISERDIKQEYEKNKTRFAKVIGGIAASGISFETPEAAQEFFNKVKGKESEFNKLASEDKNGKFRNFGTVNKDSLYVAEPIKNTILETKKFPSLAIVDVDKENWVICASDKKEPEYRSLEEVRADLENALKAKAFQELLDKKMAELKKQYTVKVNSHLIEDSNSQPNFPFNAITQEETEEALSSSQEVMKQKQKSEKKVEQNNVVAV